MNLLEIKNVSVWYQKEKNILDDVNFNVGQGVIVGLLGKNGQGKTTLLNTITGIHTDYSGEISICESTGIRNIGVKRKRFFVPDHPILFDEMTGKCYIEFLHQIYQKPWDENSYNYYAQLFEYGKFAQQSIKTLSLGNMQKTTLIAAFMIRTPLLLLDEPLVGLDVMAIENFYSEINEYIKEGNSVIFSTHLIEIIEKICTEVAILHNKRIIKRIELNGSCNVREEFNKVIASEC